MAEEIERQLIETIITIKRVFEKNPMTQIPKAFSMLLAQSEAYVATHQSERKRCGEAFAQQNALIKKMEYEIARLKRELEKTQGSSSELEKLRKERQQIQQLLGVQKYEPHEYPAQQEKPKEDVLDPYKEVEDFSDFDQKFNETHGKIQDDHLKEKLEEHFGEGGTNKQSIIAGIVEKLGVSWNDAKKLFKQNFKKEKTDDGRISQYRFKGD